MRPILIDTNAYAAFMRGDPEIGRVITHADRLCLCITVLGELLGGFTAGGREARNRAELARFMASPRVTRLPMTDDTADRYALIYAGLRRRGQPILSNDFSFWSRRV